MRSSLDSPRMASLPRTNAGPASALRFSRPAQRSLALRSACSMSRPCGPFLRSASDDVVFSFARSDCYRLERQLPGRTCKSLGMTPSHGTRQRWVNADGAAGAATPHARVNVLPQPRPTRPLDNGGGICWQESGAIGCRSSGLCGVRQVAMESTGVYWIPVFEVLDRAGFKVHLVNPPPADPSR